MGVVKGDLVYITDQSGKMKFHCKIGEVTKAGKKLVSVKFEHYWEDPTCDSVASRSTKTFNVKRNKQIEFHTVKIVNDLEDDDDDTTPTNTIKVTIAPAAQVDTLNDQFVPGTVDLYNQFSSKVGLTQDDIRDFARRSGDDPETESDYVLIQFHETSAAQRAFSHGIELNGTSVHRGVVIGCEFYSIMSYVDDGELNPKTTEPSRKRVRFAFETSESDGENRRANRVVRKKITPFKPPQSSNDVEECESVAVSLAFDS